MSENIKDLIEIREKQLIPGIDDTWLWPKADKGAYAGPFTDFESSHQHKYFKNVKNFNTVITAGANMGVYVRAYAQKFQNVYAFEPDWLNFYCMSYNCPYNNVYKFQAALGNAPGQCAMNTRATTNMGAYRVVRESKKDEQVIPMLTIDQLHLSSCDLIQLDVEGFEFEVIQGAGNVIKRFRPVIIVENRKQQVEDFILKHNYQFQEKSVSDHIYFPK